MSEERITTKQIGVPDDTDGTHIQTEYGCRYPDGHLEWATFEDYSGVRWGYASIIPGSDKHYNSDAATRWHKTLTRKAAAASIHPSEFIEEHTFVKRTVILVTTSAEEV